MSPYTTAAGTTPSTVIEFLAETGPASRRACVGRGVARNAKPLRRADRLRRLLPGKPRHRDQLAEIVATIAQLRQHATVAYDIAVGLPLGVDPLPYVEAGATWWMPEFSPDGVSLDTDARRPPRWPADTMTGEASGDVDFYDAELRRHNVHFRAAADVRLGDHVLDIGCGTGQTTREAARAAADGRALGVDVSALMLERARRLADAKGLHNVTFERGDAQSHRFASEGFDLAISRFGMMFFSDPLAAFRHLAERSLERAPSDNRLAAARAQRCLIAGQARVFFFFFFFFFFFRHRACPGLSALGSRHRKHACTT